MENHLVSVILPVYNVEKYLSICLNAVLNQTYENMEIILVDDGSTDSSGRICDEYAEKDSRIQVIHQKNQGLSAARNAGLDACKGKYVTLIDSDDRITLDYIEFLHTGITEADADIACCNFTYIDEEGKETERKRKYRKAVFDGTDTCMRAYLVGLGIDTMSRAKMYRRDVFDDVRYPVGRYFEDIATMYPIIDKINRAVVLDGYKYMDRKRSGSITDRGYRRKHPDLCPLAVKPVLGRCMRVIGRMAESKTVEREDLRYVPSIFRKYRKDTPKEKESKRRCANALGCISVPLLRKAMRFNQSSKRRKANAALRKIKRAGGQYCRSGKQILRKTKNFTKTCMKQKGIRKAVVYNREYDKTLGKNPEVFNYDESIRSQGKIAVYTCLYGNYDKLYEPQVSPENIDYIVFTDGEVPANSIWKKRDLPDTEEIRKLDTQRKSRYAKILPHKVLPEYEYSIYIDANYQVIGDLSDQIKAIGILPMAISWHPSRNCVYREGKACQLLKKDNFESIERQLDAYRKEGMPEHFGLTENNFIVRRHNDPRVEALMDEWWKEFLKHSRRDQLSFPYIIWKNGYRMTDIGHFKINSRRNPALKAKKHKKRGTK